MLHKWLAVNWIPTSNITIVIMHAIKLLYKIGCGIQFDLGQIIFEEIGEMATKLAKKGNFSCLPFPSLIFQIPLDKKVDISSSDVYTSDRQLWSMSPNVFTTTHFNDFHGIGNFLVLYTHLKMNKILITKCMFSNSINPLLITWLQLLPLS